MRGPFGRHVGFELVELDEDRCTVKLAYHDAVANGIGVVHGGAISALVDTSAVGAAWASSRNDAASRGGTVGLTVNYLRPGQDKDLFGRARVVRRGRAIVVVDVDVVDAADRHVAKGLVTYNLRQPRPDEGEAVTVLGRE